MQVHQAKNCKLIKHTRWEARGLRNLRLLETQIPENWKIFIK